MFRDGDTQIGTLRLRGIGETAHRSHRSALSRRLSFLLNTVDFSPPGIPPSGILIVRHLEDPMPGKVSPFGHAVKVETAWENAARRALKEKYHAASRPQSVDGRISSNTDAVFFEDESQLLAVLLLDIVNGVTSNRWWWKIALKQFDNFSNLVKLLCNKIAFLPAALSHLTAWGSASQIVNKLSEEDTLTVTAALAGEFHLERIAAPLLQPGGEKGEKGDRQLPGKEKKGAKKGDRPQNGPPDVPWSQWLPVHRFPDQPALPQTALLGLALSLYYAPAKVRTLAFARAFHQWWEFHIERKEKQPPTDAGVKEGVSIYDGASSPGDDKKKPWNSTIGAEDAGPLSIPTPREKRGRGPAPPVPVGKRKIGPEEKEKIGRKIRFDTDPAKPPGTVPPGPGKAKSSMSSTPSTRRIIKKTDPYFPEEGVYTRLAGVFYLVNLLERLDPPACFEALSRLESRVGAWGTLELLARALLENRYPEIEPDPLWEVLAHLDGREKGTLPGGGFHINRWVRFVLPYIRDYLRQLVKPPAQGGEEIDIVKLVLFTDARLYVTAAHVDVVMGLGDISMPVRLAGLDRDPGWKPRFARVILFHFN